MDEYDRIVLSLRAFIRGKLEVLRWRVSVWVPEPMPEDWR